MNRYRVGAVGLTSEIRFETLAPADEAGLVLFTLEQRSALPDRLLEALFSVPHREGEVRPFLTVSRGDEGYLLALDNVGRFLVAPGRIAFCLDERASALGLEQALVDQVLPRALHLAGKPSLHASAAWLEGLGAIAFTGDSGAGKSTLCAAFARRGRLVSDDSLSLEVTREGIFALPGYPSLRLWPDAAKAFAPRPDALHRATPRNPKLRMPASLVTGPVPLRAILVLERHDDPTPRLEPLHGQAAFVALQKQVHRLAPDDPTALAAEFNLLSNVVGRGCVMRLCYRPQLEAIEELADLVLKHLTR